jgi:hypothetical protein
LAQYDPSMSTRRIDAYVVVLLAGHLASAAIYLGGVIGVLAILASARVSWLWQVPWSWTVLFGAWPCFIQLLPFALLGGAAFGAQYLSRDRVVMTATLFLALAVAGLNVALLADWLISEIVNADQLRDFLRRNPGVVLGRLDGGLPETAFSAMAKTASLTLVLAPACIVIAMVVRSVRRFESKRDGIPASLRA